VPVPALVPVPAPVHVPDGVPVLVLALERVPVQAPFPARNQLLAFAFGLHFGFWTLASSYGLALDLALGLAFDLAFD
jgi:hypothetical protein